jgi:hypothetical protein
MPFWRLLLYGAGARRAGLRRIASKRMRFLQALNRALQQVKKGKDYLTRSARMVSSVHKEQIFRMSV